MTKSICETCGKVVAEATDIVVSATDYAELVQKSVDREPNKMNFIWMRSRSPIAKKPELAAFILSVAPTMTYMQIIDAIREKFGPEKTPSMSAISRFLTALNGRKASSRSRY